MRANLAVMMHSSDATDEKHLSAAQILELVERGQRCARYDEYIDHITVCPVCRETYKQLLRAEAVVREARRPRVALPRLGRAARSGGSGAGAGVYRACAVPADCA